MKFHWTTFRQIVPNVYARRVYVGYAMLGDKSILARNINWNCEPETTILLESYYNHVIIRKIVTDYNS